jgi:hypothetical protein
MVVALVALFVALGGSAYAFTVPKDSVGTAQLKDSAVTGVKLHDTAVTSSKVKPGSLLAKDFKSGQIASGLGPAGGDLTGSYPNPVIASNTISSTMFAQGAVNSAAMGIDAVNTDALVDGAVTNSKLASGAVGTSNFASAAQAPDSAQLGGMAPGAYGALLSGRINGLGTTDGSADFGAASGTTLTPGSFDYSVSTLSPDQDLQARDLTVQLTTPPNSSGASRTFTLVVNGNSTKLQCQITDSSYLSTCSDAGPIDVPPSSQLAIKDSVSGTPDKSDARFAFRLSPQ